MAQAGDTDRGYSVIDRVGRKQCHPQRGDAERGGDVRAQAIRRHEAVEFADCQEIVMKARKPRGREQTLRRIEVGARGGQGRRPIRQGRQPGKVILGPPMARREAWLVPPMVPCLVHNAALLRT